MNPVGDYDPFNFMVILLFIYAVLIGFIMILIYNNIHGSKRELVRALSRSNSNSNSGMAPETTCSNCIPSPTAIKGANA